MTVKDGPWLIIGIYKMKKYKLVCPHCSFNQVLFIDAVKSFHTCSNPECCLTFVVTMGTKDFYVNTLSPSHTHNIDESMVSDDSIQAADSDNAEFSVDVSHHTLTDEQFNRLSQLGRLETQAYLLCQRLGDVYYSVLPCDLGEDKDSRLSDLLDRAFLRRQRRYSAFKSFSQSVGIGG